jgi:hypothetical protein
VTRTVRLTGHAPDAWVEAQAGKLLDLRHVETVVSAAGGDVDYRRPDGSLLLAFRTREWLEARVPPPGLRRAWAAARQVARWSERHQAFSGIAGWFDEPYPRVTDFTRRHRAEWRDLQLLARGMDAVRLAACPDEYAALARVTAPTDPYYLITGTRATTMTVNRDWWSPCHRDDGNLGLSVLTVFDNRLPGSLLVLPKWGIGVDVRDGETVIADLAREYHGNSPPEGSPAATFRGRGVTPDAAENHWRFSVVLYFREALRDAGPPGRGGAAPPPQAG